MNAIVDKIVPFLFAAPTSRGVYLREADSCHRSTEVSLIRGSFSHSIPLTLLDYSFDILVVKIVQMRNLSPNLWYAYE